jgi:hypothetical protein
MTMMALGLAIATVVAFLVSFTYYAVVPAAPAPEAKAAVARDARPEPWRIAVELLRSAVVAGLLTGLMRTAGWDGAAQGALLGLTLWSLPIVLLSGSVLWERVPARSAMLHAGDWLLKLVAIGGVVGLFT